MESSKTHMNIVVVDKSTHGQTKVCTKRGPYLDEQVHFVPIVISEIEILAQEYPIVIAIDPASKQAELGVLLGLEKNQNLFIKDKRWRTKILPLNIRRQPFFISLDTHNNRSVITIDDSSPRLQQEFGHDLFDKEGSPSPFLMNIGKILSQLIRGKNATQLLIETLKELNLLGKIPLAEQKLDSLFIVDPCALHSHKVRLENHQDQLPQIHALAKSAYNLKKLSTWQAKIAK